MLSRSAQALSYTHRAQSHAITWSKSVWVTPFSTVFTQARIATVNLSQDDWLAFRDLARPENRAELNNMRLDFFIGLAPTPPRASLHLPTHAAMGTRRLRNCCSRKAPRRKRIAARVEYRHSQFGGLRDCGVG